MSSLGKKYVMALTGFILVGFVIGHMLGNLQMFLHPDWINEYAYKLQHLPYGLLWIVRLVMLTAIVAHIVAAVLLVIGNKRARPSTYEVEKPVQASFASRTMKVSGVILAAFVVFHLMHFTIQSVHPEFRDLHVQLQGEQGAEGDMQSRTIHGVYDKLAARGKTSVHDVYSMVVIGFSRNYWYVSLFYILSMGLLCLHLSHGVSSMFQSLGWRNAVWRRRLDRIALVIGLALFIGYAAIPAAVLAGALPYQDMAQTMEAANH